MLKRSVLRNENGNAMIEIVPILTIFILLVNFSLGFFGLIHSGILNSIAARNYTFETFRNKADLTYLRDITDDSSQPDFQPQDNLKFTYKKSGQRFHATKNEYDMDGGGEKFYATRRPIKFSDIREVEGANAGNRAHHMRVKNITEGQRASESGIEDESGQVWVRTAYGICIKASCGG